MSRRLTFARPAFEARGKGKIRNLGNAPVASDDEEEDDDSDKTIAVTRPAFEAEGSWETRQLERHPRSSEKEGPRGCDFRRQKPQKSQE
jgi:hypothetical protein